MWPPKRCPVVGKNLDALSRAGMRYAVTGSAAVYTILELDLTPNDLDIVVPSFDSVPHALMESFLCIHAHPDAPPGKLLAQFVDPDAPLRIDVFREQGTALARTIQRSISGRQHNIVSKEDLFARAARELMPLCTGSSAPRKAATTYARLRPQVHIKDGQAAWNDHRESHHPHNFVDAMERIDRALEAHADLLIEPTYTVADEACSKCDFVAPFARAPRQAIVDILGYC